MIWLDDTARYIANGAKRRVFNDVPAKALAWCMQMLLGSTATPIFNRINEMLGRAAKKRTIDFWLYRTMKTDENQDVKNFLSGGRSELFAPPVTIDCVIIWFIEEYPALNVHSLHSRIVELFWEGFCEIWHIQV